MGEDTRKILVVDDERDIRSLLKIYVKKMGYEFLEAEDGAIALDVVRENPDLDLIVMDIMMPNMDGIAACTKIRELSKVPVLFLTAKTKEPDQNQAYDAGGDDFLAKPFTQGEFNRKVSALIRRYNVYQGKMSQNGETDNGEIIIKNIVIDPANQRVKKNGEIVRLTDKEYDLLIFLAEHLGEPWSIADLYEKVWGEEYLTSSSNTIMVHMLRLRQKLEDNPQKPEILKTIYGKGYQVG
jgi:DNA-binding response OmpR family regulator